MRLKLLIVFVLTTSFLYFLLQYEKDDKIENYLNKKTKQYEIIYNTQYDKFYQTSNILFHTFIEHKVVNIYKKLQTANKEEKNILRKDLYKLLEQDYKKLKHINLQQLHFHLPNNESFLRFHKSSKFGDNLTNVRETIKYVNENKKPISGYEAGRIISGYRFVYPIKDTTNNHLGSVEISFNISTFTSEFMKNFKVLSNFHIKKEVIDKKVWQQQKDEYYQPSTLKGFYVEKKVLETFTKYARSKTIQKPSKKTIAEAMKTISSNKALSIYDKKLEKTITFLPIKNPITKEVVAFISIRSEGKYVKNKTNNFYLLFAIVNLFIVTVFTFIYRELRIHENINKILAREVDKKTAELQDINEHLEQRIKDEVTKNEERNKQVFESQKMASMGEMIGNIAHQWRQPLAAISSITSRIKLNQHFNTLTPENIIEDTDDINRNVKFLSETIDIFRDFIKEKKELREVILQDRIDNTLRVVSSSLENNYINLINNIDYGNPIKLNMIIGELSQVLINIFNNAKDALIKEDSEENKWIKLDLEVKDNIAIITIEDNGGGIPDDILPKIFEPYFTTKHQSQGTGLGLHMSKKIVNESLHGKIYVKNTKYGAKFFVEIPL